MKQLLNVTMVVIIFFGCSHKEKKADMNLPAINFDISVEAYYSGKRITNFDSKEKTFVFIYNKSQLTETDTIKIGTSRLQSEKILFYEELFVGDKKYRSDEYGFGFTTQPFDENLHIVINGESTVIPLSLLYLYKEIILNKDSENVFSLYFK